MVWEFKGQEGNSHGEGKANFSNYMFAGPSLTTGAERTLSKWALPGSYLSHLVLLFFLSVLYISFDIFIDYAITVVPFPPHSTPSCPPPSHPTSPPP